jgi:hypothetical protein
MQTTSEPRQVEIHNEFDIVNLRHTVRQMARAIGLDLTRQAKVTVAISALARAFLPDQGDVLFKVQVAREPRESLEVICISSDTHQAQNAEQLERMLDLHEVRMLVDEFHIVLFSNNVHLTIRMWLAN